jgi:uncharacterized protein (DUF2267 family)
MHASAITAFESTLEKSNTWIRQLMEELGWDDPQRTYHGLRAVLHALRDRLPLAEVGDLSAQLPMLIRGVYFENWRPNRTPVADKTVEQFYAHVYDNFPNDFQFKAEDLVRAVFWLLSQHISQGEIADVKATLPVKIRELWDY